MNRASVEKKGQSVLPNLCQDKSVFFLVLVSEVFVVLLLLADQGRSGFDWQRLSVLTLHVQWVCLVSAAVICSSRRRISTWSPSRQLAFAYITTVLNGFLVSLAGQILLNPDGPHWPLLARHVAMTMLIAALVLRYFYLQYQLVLQSRAEVEARLQALHSRIRPHFLFNSLNSVASLIPVDPDKAEQAVEDLADIFRATLKHSSDQVSLAQEIELARRYLFVESLRLGDRLGCKWNIKADVNKWSLPHLTLQPLVENAIVHGLQALPKGGQITIDIFESERWLKVTIANPLPDTAVQSAGNRMGLENIRHRLKALYGDGAQVNSFISEHQYRCVLNIPQQAQKGALV